MNLISHYKTKSLSELDTYDLRGYFMGSRIGESFYINHNLANNNLTPLIEIKNLEKFIRQSRYFEGPKRSLKWFRGFRSVSF